ncbi:hypothetical protein ACIOZM_19260 [Pseudomonas sp. NPDC087346]|uniref:hypothetical protein n=1 Tax=Pseudomonas sp. NPDC087346 TaxID=3364438 RepID=UPI003812AC23
MLLITLKEMLWPPKGEPADAPSKTVIAMATNLPLEQALSLILEHEHAYRQRYSQAIEHKLQAVSNIDDVSKSVLMGMDVRLVEDLELTPEAF